MLSKGSDDMQRLMSSYHVCCPRAVMVCYTRRRLTMLAIQERRCHATPDVVLPCMLSKGGDGMPRLTLLTVCAVQGR